ncbi:MAG: hypothetical protein AB7F75_08715 [Planctomycetota bacterium]
MKLKFLAALLALFFGSSTVLAEEEHGHEHEAIKPSHDGVIIEVGEHAAVVEVVHDEKAGTMEIWVMDAHGKPLAIEDAPRINLMVHDGDHAKPVQVTTNPVDAKDGKTDRFSAQDEKLKGHLEGRISIKIEGKPYQVALPHDDAHHEKHDHEGDAHEHDHH